MTLSASGLSLYALALFILFLTPGPVWVAVVARSLANGFRGAWPLAMGVVVGDVLWPLLAIFGVTAIATVYGDFLQVLRWAAAVIFLVMGWGLIRKAGALAAEDSALTRPGIWPGFLAGLLAILGNPKAVLFYMGVLPGFFDLSAVTALDITVICLISAIVPLIGNLILGVFVGRARALIRSPQGLARLNIGAGILLIGVGIVIGLGAVFA
ncbi:LysE family translocator [Halovulum sp. GXIMD14793]